jgi:S-adenosylmethionine:tRNA ribosyltransferase-isomerase
LRPGGALEETVFSEFPSLLRAGDLLVLNETRVIAARLIGTRAGGGGAEVLLLRPADRPRYDPAARRWLALVRPGRRLRPCARVEFGSDGFATIETEHEDGLREVTLEIAMPFEDFLALHGRMPLPPYVGSGERSRDARYQTVFARVPGSVAAPTASLHFTERTFGDLTARGVELARVVLDVGLGTFRPIATATIDGHRMHAERYAVPPATRDAIAAARARGARVVAAGTTVVRTLEGAADESALPRPGEGETSLFITPGYRFRTVDALLTNFHLPGSTLLTLVAAFAGYERTMSAYRNAVERGFRFFSFGDAMFVEREAP